MDVALTSPLGGLRSDSSLVLALLAAGMLLGLLAPSASASSFTIVQPTEKYAGKTYGQWSAAWWQWANISEPDSPVTDATGADCAVKQMGPVWFLAGTTGGSATRSCTVPPGKAILVPIINAECDTLTPPTIGGNEAALQACAKDLMDHVTQTSASVDGTAIDLGPVSQGRFRFQSPLFTITFAPNNGFYPDGSVAGTGQAVADGFWLLIRPLSAGRHTIDFQGTAVFGDSVFQVGVHYDLTVTKNR
jgi:hypothetical protein